MAVSRKINYSPFDPLLMSWLVVMMTSLPLTSQCPSTGATDHLRSLLLGKCLHFKNVVHPEQVCGPSKIVNCSTVADLFIGAFAGLDSCNVTTDRYDAYLEATRHPIPVDGSLFWENVYPFVHHYSNNGRRLTTQSDTLAGYLGNGAHFCSDPEEEGGIGGPDTQFCPDFTQTDNCSLNAEASFWTAGSKHFALKARGVITIMLNASVDNVFPDPSYFLRSELPYLNAPEVTGADIWLVHVPGQPVRVTCEDGEVKTLQSRLKQKNIPSTCSANPQDVLWLMCWDHQTDPECKAMFSTSSSGFANLNVASTIPWLVAVFLFQIFL